MSMRVRNKMNKMEKEKYRKVREYEGGLRAEAEKALKLKIPSVPQNIDPLVEILFLERLLHLNRLGEIAHAYYECNGKAIYTMCRGKCEE